MGKKFIFKTVGILLVAGVLIGSFAGCTKLPDGTVSGDSIQDVLNNGFPGEQKPAPNSGESANASSSASNGTDATAGASSLTGSDASGTTSGTSSAGSSAGSSSASGSTRTGSAATKSTTSSTTKSTTSGKPTTGTTAKPVSSSIAMPAEVKGVWLSYIELSGLLNGKTVAQAKSNLDAVMSNCKAYGLNTIYFHVRANSDAYYQSSYFKPAKAAANLLNSGFDPLTYAVEAAHKNGLRLEAWVNPYRIGTDISYKVSSIKSDDVFKYGSSWYYVPTSVSVQGTIADGIREIVTRYAVDGIQFDDYFYPNGSMNATSASSFEKTDYTNYQKAGGKLSISDWRRSHVSAMVRSTYNIVHTRKSCAFGISPEADADKNYSGKYADIKLWLSSSGYVDYIMPQIYFGFLNTASPFEKTVRAWEGYPRASSVRLLVGLGLYKTGINDDHYAGAGRTEWANNSDIMKRQVQYLRTRSGCKGFGLYSYSFFDKNKARETAYSKDVAGKEIANLKAVL